MPAQGLDRDELSAWLRLTLAPGIGRALARRLLVHCGGSVQALFEDAPAQLRALLNPAQCTALLAVSPAQRAAIDTCWQWLHAPPPGLAHAVVALGDPRYPAQLLATEDPPLLLYVAGPECALAPGRQLFAPQRALAMVGSRHPSAQGLIDAERLAQELCAAGLCIVSGMALGIDGAAHAGALRAARAPDAGPATIAVWGTGLDQPYPRRHAALAQRIVRAGLLVSEYPLGTPPLAGNFPQRNRIIAGLAQGTLVVEAALASGSLITARLAAEQGREVFAIPGSIHAPQSHGCHALLRQGAKLVETAQDVLEELQGLPPCAPAAAAAPRSCPAETALEKELLTALGFDPLGLDELVARTGWSAAQLQAALLELELAGRVARLAGGVFQRVERG